MVKTVTIKTLTGDQATDEFVTQKSNEPLDNNGRVYLEEPTPVDVVQIIFESAINEAVVDFVIRLEIYLCSKPLGKCASICYLCQKLPLFLVTDLHLR